MQSYLTQPIRIIYQKPMQVQLIYCINYCQKSIGLITVLEERLGIQYGVRHLRDTVATLEGGGAL